ncbi:MAG: hypothetical protein WCX70_03045 [Candidatus Paceibacterota bacterium]|jgi:hypothetical protein
MKVKGTTSQEINLALARKVVRICLNGGDSFLPFSLLKERCGVKGAIHLLAQEANGKMPKVAEALLNGDGMDLWVMVLMSPQLAEIGFAVLAKKNLSKESAQALLQRIHLVDLKYRETVRRNCLERLRVA